MMMQIFVDMDGVLADFDRHYDMKCGRRAEDGYAIWSLVHRVPDFFSTIPPMADVEVLWGYIRRYKPIVLTGVPPSVPGVAEQKRQWIARFIDPKVQVITCASRDKCKFITGKGDILIDDRPHHSTLWKQAGGIWITHTTAENTIRELRRRGY